MAVDVESLKNEVEAANCPWVRVALRDLSVTQGDDTAVINPKVETFLRTVGAPLIAPQEGRIPERRFHPAHVTYWCSAFANYCMKSAGYIGTNNAAASSWLSWGIPLLQPRFGCVTVFKREGGNHVGFFIKPSTKPGRLHILGGNQHNSVCYSDFKPGKCARISLARS